MLFGKNVAISGKAMMRIVAIKRMRIKGGVCRITSR